MEPAYSWCPKSGVLQEGLGSMTWLALLHCRGCSVSVTFGQIPKAGNAPAPPARQLGYHAASNKKQKNCGASQGGESEAREEPGLFSAG